MLSTRRNLIFSAKTNVAMTSPMSRWLTAAAFAAGLCFATAAFAQEGGSPLSVLDRMFGRNSSAAEPQPSGQVIAQAPATELVLRIERLEAQIRQMTGTIEQLQYRNQQLETQIRGMGGSAGAQPGQSLQQARPSVQAGPPPPVPGRRSDVFDPAQQPNAPGAPRVLGNIPVEPPSIITAEPPVGAPGGRGAGAPLDLSTLATGVAPGPAAEPGQPAAAGPLPPPPSRNLSATGVVASVEPSSDSPKDYYDLAYGYVVRKDYAQAEDGFQAFLRKFPNDRRAADAQFWLGESLFQRQRYDAAAQAFLDLSTKHGGHGKAPDALLRLAQSLAALKQKEMACATLAEVGRKYPRASNSVKQGVEREQKRVSC
jgi:tol-pal system protein YbgF